MYWEEFSQIQLTFRKLRHNTICIEINLKVLLNSIMEKIKNIKI
jgi:hypothetical protein